MLRRSRRVHLGAGVLMLAIPASAVALTAGQADTQSAIRINPHPRHVAYGRKMTVTGTLAPSSAGQPLRLQYAPPGSANWRSVAATRAGQDGRFALGAVFRRSGRVRVAAAPGGVPLPAGAVGTRAGTGGGAIAPSATAPLSVRARFSVHRRAIDVLTGQLAHVHGKLLPAVAGRRVRLLGRSGKEWHTVATGRTGARGGFDLHYNPADTGRRWLRVRFQGDRLNAPSWAHAGQVTVFRESLASRYTDGGGTACGFHAYYGVANKSLPCGTKVTFNAGGRSVTAIVDDRGPYVGAREWDLNQNTAGALGFGGVGTVWSSI